MKKLQAFVAVVLLCQGNSPGLTFGFRVVRPLTKVQHTNKLKRHLTTIDLEIGLWTTAFSASHIGMSAIRRDIIQGCGEAAEILHIVGNPDWRLPEFWPGDDDGGKAIFPTAEVAGRQIYRMIYTAISFATLGSALYSYLESVRQNPPQLLTGGSASLCFCVSVLSWAISIASLLNPSPLSLVPVFEARNITGEKTEDSSPIVQRNDARKLTAYGMTRITRHPLILPVVPWGVATSMILGGEPRDFLLFGVLALYAIAGCYAQDLRVSREEGSVGTVFHPDDSLQSFFLETSFVPFQAVVDGRQSLTDIVKEVPWWALVLGVAVGCQMQAFILNWIVAQASSF